MIRVLASARFSMSAPLATNLFTAGEPWARGGVESLEAQRAAHERVEIPEGNNGRGKVGDAGVGFREGWLR